MNFRPPARTIGIHLNLNELKLVQSALTQSPLANGRTWDGAVAKTERAIKNLARILEREGEQKP